MHLNELKNQHISAVQQQAEELQIDNAGRMRKQELMMAIIKKRAKAGEQVVADASICIQAMRLKVRCASPKTANAISP